MPFPTSMGLQVAAALAGTAFAGAAIFLSTRRAAIRLTIPVSGALLLAVALFGLLPELAQDTGWVRSCAAFAGGFLLLTALDNMGVAVCPDCSHEHEHEHDSCGSPLHGFAIPLLLAGAVHSLFDGWALAATHDAGSAAVRVGLPLALVIHKIPEGLALGGLMKAAVRSRGLAFTLAALAESMTIAGGLIANAYGMNEASVWTRYPLGVAGGAFVYLGGHALHGEWKRRRRRVTA